MNTNIKFTNKTEYLAYRAEWKAKYKELSQTIRERKQLHKMYQRAWNKHYIETKGNFSSTYALTKQTLENNPDYVSLFSKYKDDRTTIQTYKERATQMLEELKEAKIEAQRQYLASKTELVMA